MASALAKNKQVSETRKAFGCILSALSLAIPAFCIWMIIATYLFSGWGDGGTVRDLRPILLFSLILVVYIAFTIYLSRRDKIKEKRKKLSDELESVYKHPKYTEFMESNPEHRYIYKEHLSSVFEKWLKENDANQSVVTTPEAPPPTS